jgi:hypothetical protein
MKKIKQIQFKKTHHQYIHHYARSLIFKFFASLSLLMSPQTFAAETKIKLEDLAPVRLAPAESIDPSQNTSNPNRLQPIEVSESASFEVLARDPITPKKIISIPASRPNLFQNLRQTLPYSVDVRGYPSGNNSVNLGGRSVEDTQVSTLGVPLALPQGGGADLSGFGHFLWDRAVVSTAPNSAAFVQQSASGSIELKSWSREQLRRPYRLRDLNSQASVSYNRQASTFSIGSRYQNTAVIAGSSFGLLTGPSAGLSHEILNHGGNYIALHALGFDTEGTSPGSRTFSTPNNLKKNWRLLPVLETRFNLLEGVRYEGTLYGDIQRLRFQDPTNSAFDSDTRTFQYGIENAIRYQNWTLGLSGRYVRFTGAPISVREEYPLRSTLGYTQKNNQTTYDALIGADSLQTAGTGLIAKLGTKFQATEINNWFTSLQTLPKLPTLTARYYSIAGYVGNPNLKPEQVTFLTAGLDHNANFKNGPIRALHAIRAERRNRIQLTRPSTTPGTNTALNAGNAYLFSLQSDTGFRIHPNLTLNQNLLLTKSRIDQTQNPYPSLSVFSDRLHLAYEPNDHWQLDAYSQIVADSIESSGKKHAGYSLYDLMLIYRLTGLDQGQYEISGGIENLFDRRAEITLENPLPGRIAQLGFTARF